MNETRYDDQIVKMFFTATVIWGAVGMLVGVILALQLAWFPANLGIPYITFGRLRPLHTNAVIFAFGGNMCSPASTTRCSACSRRACSTTCCHVSTSGAGRRSPYRLRSRSRSG